MSLYRQASALIAGMGAIFLAGCAVGPAYVRPAVAAPAAFMGQARIDQRTAATAANPDQARADWDQPRAVRDQAHAGRDQVGTDRHALSGAPTAWWQSFNDPLLDRFIDRALAQNLDLEQAVARVRQARASLRNADAALLPSGTVTGDATRSRFSVETPIGEVVNSTPGFDRTGNVFEADLGASWEIDLFGGLRRGRQSAVALYQAARIGVAASRLTVAAQTADTYVAIRGLQTRIAITQDQVDRQRQLVSLVKLQLGKGVASTLQLNQAEGSLAQVEASLPALASALDAAMNALDVLVGAQPGTYRAELGPVAGIPAAPAIANAAGPADLIRRRPDLVVAERKLEAANAQIGVALSEYYPKFSLNGLIGSATMKTGDLFTDGSNQWQGVLGLRWRLFDFGRVDAEVSAARGRHAEALASYRLSVLRATEDVEDAFSALVNSESQEQTLARGEDSLRLARDASVAAYKGGVVSLIEVIDADTRLLGTRDARAQARTQAARAAIASFKALGGGWTADRAAI